MRYRMVNDHPFNVRTLTPSGTGVNPILEPVVTVKGLSTRAQLSTRKIDANTICETLATVTPDCDAQVNR
jgi:hypothetical protein